ncbi:MAG TPA: hypothetical protein VLU46_02365 [Thermoanaerobaculia bacterium]|nr:hypothetical protein [Thermoanaerobaculia bacterium]
MWKTAKNVTAKTIALRDEGAYLEPRSGHERAIADVNVIGIAENDAIGHRGNGPQYERYIADINVLRPWSQ